MGGQSTTLIIILLFLGAVAVLIYLPRFLWRRAMRQVIAVFRKHGATSPSQATTLESLGLVRAGPVDRMFKTRDYRPQAVTVLGQTGIIRANEEGLFYLSEETLANSPVKDLARAK